MNDFLNFIPKKKLTSADVLRAFRKNFRVSQEELADATGIAQANISSYESYNGERRGRKLGLDNAVKIAIFFGIDPIELLFPNGLENDLDNFESIHNEAQRISKLKMA